MKTAAEVRQRHAEIISNAVDNELARIMSIIEKHLADHKREQTIAIQLDMKTSSQVKVRLQNLGYQIRESEYDPREPNSINYTYISW